MRQSSLKGQASTYCPPNSEVYRASRPSASTPPLLLAVPVVHTAPRETSSFRRARPALCRTPPLLGPNRPGSSAQLPQVVHGIEGRDVKGPEAAFLARHRTLVHLLGHGVSGAAGSRGYPDQRRTCRVYECFGPVRAFLFRRTSSSYLLCFIQLVVIAEGLY